jgi:hypothetical protein
MSVLSVALARQGSVCMDTRWAENALVTVTCAALRRPTRAASSTSTLSALVDRYPAMSIPALPDDILHLLCEELADQRQFDTLFNCACASRKLAVPALTHLYR